MESKALAAYVLVEAAAVGQGIACQSGAALIRHLACIRGTHEANLTGRMDHEQVFDWVARLLATIVVLWFLWICGPVD